MSDKPYWQQLRDLKLGKPFPAPGKQTKSTDKPPDEEKDTEVPAPAKSPEKNPKPKKKGMRKVSKKRARQERQYRPVRKKFLEQNSTCQAGLEGCTGISTEIHHSQGREGDRLIKVEDFKALCANCHRKITDQSRQAIAAGHSKSRLGKPNKNPLA